MWISIDMEVASCLIKIQHYIDNANHVKFSLGRISNLAMLRCTAQVLAESSCEFSLTKSKSRFCHCCRCEPGVQYSAGATVASEAMGKAHVQSRLNDVNMAACAHRIADANKKCTTCSSFIAPLNPHDTIRIVSSHVKPRVKTRQATQARLHCNKL